MRNKQLIILGGGSSVIEGINKNLFNILKDRFVIGLNYAHYFIDTTCLMYVDDVFYNKQAEYLKELPLTIGKYNSSIKETNNIGLPTINYYCRDCKKGIYNSTLAGLFALTLGIYILEEGEIFLLGYDNGAKKGKGLYNREYIRNKPLTHWYQYGNIISRYTNDPLTLIHRGIGKINWYEATEIDKKTNKRISRCEREYGVYANESKIKIYNVSPESRIPTFEKITYDQFFYKLNTQIYDQVLLRKEIKKKLIILKNNISKEVK